MVRDGQIKSIILAIFLLVGILFAGTIGFIILEGFTVTEAFYMTVITIATVGFEEVRQLDNKGMIFTAILIITSFGVFVYVVTAFTRFLVEGVFRNYYKDNKVKKRIKKLSGHVILCGYGRNGKQAAIELEDHQKQFVIIESNKEVLEYIREETNYLYIDGDATHEEVLDLAQVMNAEAIVSTLPNDADNLFVVLTARQINSKLKIISRASEDKSDTKLKRAGANNVIMPDKIGGQRMAKLVVQPDVVEFIEYIMLQRSQDVAIEEVSCKGLASCFENKSIKELGIRNITGANILGLKKDKSYIFNPSPDVYLSNNDQLFVLGNPDQIGKLKELLVTGTPQ